MKESIWGVKEPEYVMKIMLSRGALILDDNCKKVMRKGTERNGTVRQVQFTYTKPFDWHFCYHHIVDDHYNLSHASPALEETLITKHWMLGVFTQSLNLYLVLSFFAKTDENTATYLDFCHKLGWILIDNPYLKTEQEQVKKEQ